MDEETTVYEHKPWLEVSLQTVRLPSGQLVDDYHKVVTPDFIEVFAVSDDGYVLAEQQYKHGVGEVSLTLPSGNIEHREDPESAARRELLEETGYSASEFRKLGEYVVHGNYGCATAHLFMARGIKKVAEPNSGDLEEMWILKLRADDLKAAVLGGQVKVVTGAAAIMIATDPTLVFTDTGASFEQS
ncbi:NUDIX hydrolase [Candidatus Lucifugimonas marina]|uniref:NUDIX hydrolase n=1 Tax=Candidatus Lucifugimonas marina TaxID=3038979 RepID=UPI00319DDEFF